VCVPIFQYLACWIRDVLHDPIGERLDSERRRDDAMLRRRGAFLPWAR
jgi:hypothetical protein